MKKFLFLALGLLAVLTISAGNFEKNETTGMYLYTGAEVDGVSVDFSTWAADSLVDAAVGDNYTTAAHTLSFAERGGLGFQKWVIYPNRWLASGVTKNALFNNGKTNNTVAANERPFVYFPAVKGGVKEIKVNGVVTWMTPYYYDATAAAWKSLASITGGNTLQETVISFESVDATMVAFSVSATGYYSITNLEVVSKTAKEEPIVTPRDSVYKYNAATGMYHYIGAPVETFSVDFSTWAADSLVDAAVGADYVSAAPTLKFEERGNMGFQKFVIYPNRWLASGVTKNALFHNGKDNAGLTDSLQAATFYLPTIKSGIKSVEVSMSYGNKVLEVLSLDSATNTWSVIGNIIGTGAYAPVSLDINNAAVKTLAMRVKKANGGAYLSISDITVIPMAAEEPIVTPRDSVYKYNAATGMYHYIGAPVETFSVDFSTWAADSLVDAAVGADYVSAAPTLKFEERGNMGFQKFVIYKNRWLASGVTKNALFHNGKDNAGLTDSLQAATVFLPTIKEGIKTLEVTMNYATKVLDVLSLDAATNTWSVIGNIIGSGAYGTVSLDINNADVKTLALRVKKENGGAYLSVTNIDVTPMGGAEQPVDSALYRKTASGIYEYQGEPVSAINLDFTSWSKTDLPDVLSDDMELFEAQNCGFVKWKIASRPCGDKGTVNALFNNDNGDFPDGKKNNATANRPRIYFPTTAESVDSIKVFCGYGNTITVMYKDEDHASWTQAGTIPVTTAYAEHTFVLNSKGKTTVYFEYAGTSWMAWTDINFFMKGAPIAVTDVTLDITESQLEIGKTLQLTASVLPDNATDKTITWTTDNAEVATVDANGLVTGVAAGLATITAQAGTKTAQALITVMDKVIAPTAIKWNVESKEIQLNMGDSIKLSYTIEPADATMRDVILVSSRPNCATISDDGWVRTYGGGKVEISAVLGDLSDVVTINVYDPNMPQGELDWDPDGTYWGEKVDYIYENFNEWPLTALSDEIIDDIQQYKKLGFVRYKMANRGTYVAEGWDGTDVRNCLFSDQSGSIATTPVDKEHMRFIYLPTLKKGAGAIRITGNTGSTNGCSFGVSFYNTHYSEDQAGYTYIKGVLCEGKGVYEIESELNIPDTMDLTLQISQWLGGVWPVIWSIQVSPYGYPLSDDPDHDFGQLSDVQNVAAEENKAIKMLVDGQLIIVRKNEIYNAQGQKIATK